MENTIHSLWQTYSPQMKRRFQESRTELPFFWFLTAILVFFLVGTIIYVPLSSWPIKILFILLMSAHILFYWVILFIDTQSVRNFLIYVSIQTLFVLLLLWIVQNVYIAPAIIMTLIGQISGFTIPGKHKILTITILGAILFLYVLWIQPAFFANPLLTFLTFGLVLVFQFIFTGVYNRTSTAKHEAEEALEKLEIANMKIEQMTRTEERQRIARELHDTLAQGLTGIILQLDAVDHYLEKGDTEKAQAVIQRSMQAARATLGESRQVIDNLRQSSPPLTLREKLEVIVANSSVKTILSLDLPADLNNPESELIEKLIGEALTNVQKHARASQVELILQHNAAEIQLTIEDNGIGFDPSALNNQIGHYGLLGMQERVKAAQGSFELQTHPSAGCRLKIQFPRIKD